jgi:hypothetical protein
MKPKKHRSQKIIKLLRKLTHRMLGEILCLGGVETMI